VDFGVCGEQTLQSIVDQVVDANIRKAYRRLDVDVTLQGFTLYNFEKH